ncbi:hypothetical protein Z517_03471 [Fonsecaea pedrosoi CBS 271.37]|uniref:BRCT domain-containing protein n=1 Tax=Fonsecaea pedrosoi CBS 271.37 TaxID=1442368 RepID=A0A0D2FC61_9EURO|nr:uncharacterized protein Z517_03471 [Fonsecaea pedrosoi CBS 271.37]KIW84222.1 hypothetical protein Z517_03471 [Fonsecaea pedrosoi CBS 271.37]
MAPRKAVSPAKPRRITRARAADAGTTTAATTPIEETSKRRTTKAAPIPTTSGAKALEAKSRVTKKTTTSKGTKGGRANTRSAKVLPVPEEDVSDHDDDEEVMAATVTKPPVKPSRTSTRTTSNTSAPTATAGLAAAPRRRVKVTPLTQNDSQPEPVVTAPSEEVTTAKKTSAKAKKESTSAEEKKPATSRSKKESAAVKQNKDANVAGTNPEPKKRGRGRTVQNDPGPEEGPPQVSTSTAAKSRGKPKKEKIPLPPVEEPKPAPVTTRQTRARAGSVNSSVAAEPAVSVVVPVKKKVTFEALPEDDDEKENKRPRTMAKSKSTKTSAASKKAETTATGMRAKPIRKPATTRTTKATRATGASQAVASKPQKETELTEKIQARALTPKKITQVAKAMPMDSDDEEEDELAGAKTPVRDLSLSPKRGLAASATRPLSPIKKLDFSPAFHLGSPQKNHISEAMAMLSPPRRQASPAKDSLKESPRRAPEGVTIFRANVPDIHNTAALVLDPCNTQSMLHQSPKRGLSDRLVFPPSAVKSRTTPLKTSLLSSPARRLFSASKQRTPAQVSPSFGKISEQESPESSVDEAVLQNEESEEVVVSSHFRSSVSPQRLTRVYRLSEDELAEERDGDVDFDQSVLNIRSPLKVDKSKPVEETLTEEMVLEDPAVEDDDQSAAEENGHEEYMEVDATDNTAPDPAVDADETIVDPEFEADEPSDEEEISDIVEDVGAHATEDAHQDVESPVKKPRMSDALFSRLRHIDDDSEDELAVEQTPDNRALRPSFRSSIGSVDIRSRLSTGVVPESASKNLGFTPLAAQVQGWRAASPEKKASALSRSRGLFSPVAQIHVTGAVELSRPNTPGRESSKRKSIASRLSLAASTTESPAGPNFFADGMAAQDFEDQVEDDAAAVEDEDLHNLIAQDVSQQNTPDELDGEVEASSGDEAAKTTAELTTDLINFTNASDTAMVDFKALANEAEDLAAQDGHDTEAALNEQEANVTVPTVLLETVNEAQSMLSVSTSSGSYGDENTAPIESSADESETDEMEELPTEESAECHAKVIDEAREEDSDIDQSVPEGAEQDEDAINATSDTEDELLEVTAASIETSPPKNDHAPAYVESVIQEMDFNVTPVRPDPGLPRYVQTVVSKVPLRPEGEIPLASSPLKVQRKRPRSLSSSHVQAVKRRSLGPILNGPSFNMDPLATPRANVAMSPQRRIRSAAPSPANSLASGLTTPGQMSFTADDFGDSTLDGIDLPEEELMSDDVEETEIAEQDESVLSIGSALFRTPAAASKRSSIVPSTGQSKTATTPRYAMSTKSSSNRLNATPKFTPLKGASGPKTPATVARAKTPSTSVKPKSVAKTPQTGRNPLKPVGNGVLHGAIVHTDIHTSEGMDASAFYIDLLTSMGARVVKEWRWNPRASIPPTNQDSTDSGDSIGNVGITHVVYKDGGKRTLEKVRSAKGQVLCVGVSWVLDCMREGKWLDESAFAVDASIMPRGGSRRRKSMEPRMLVNANGLLSTSRDQRRSVSAEYMGFTGEMKADLIQTPVRGDENRGNGVEVEDESEISSTYNSPTAATMWGGGDTANVGALMAQQDKETPGSVVSKKFTTNVSTPKSVSLEVDYDPRTAATPLTPYLVAKGRELVQMSAPPKQINKSLFDRDEDDDSAAPEKGQANGGKKFQVKMQGKSAKGLLDARRKTLGVGVAGMGFQPRFGSPLRKE